MTLSQLEALMGTAGFETSETRNSDSLDFADVNVAVMKEIILKAYSLGVKDAAGK